MPTGFPDGSKKHPLYPTWKQMRQRCSNKSFRDYKYYGGRGISVCERWENFWLFVADVGPRPKGMTLDRINNNGNYEPSNCRWATKKEQSINSRRAHIVVVNGERLSKRELAVRLGVSQKEALRRIAKFGIAKTIEPLVISS